MRSPRCRGDRKMTVDPVTDRSAGVRITPPPLRPSRCDAANRSHRFLPPEGTAAQQPPTVIALPLSCSAGTSYFGGNTAWAVFVGGEKIADGGRRSWLRSAGRSAPGSPEPPDPAAPSPQCDIPRAAGRPLRRRATPERIPPSHWRRRSWPRRSTTRCRPWWRLQKILRRAPPHR